MAYGVWRYLASSVNLALQLLDLQSSDSVIIPPDDVIDTPQCKEILTPWQIYISACMNEITVYDLGRVYCDQV